MWGFCPGTIVHHGLLIERAVGVCVCGGGGVCTVLESLA